MGWLSVSVHPDGDASEDGAGGWYVLNSRNGDQLLSSLCRAAMDNIQYPMSDFENGTLPSII